LSIGCSKDYLMLVNLKKNKLYRCWIKLDIGDARQRICGIIYLKNEKIIVCAKNMSGISFVKEITGK